MAIDDNVNGNNNNNGNIGFPPNWNKQQANRNGDSRNNPDQTASIKAAEKALKEVTSGLHKSSIEFKTSASEFSKSLILSTKTNSELTKAVNALNSTIKSSIPSEKEDNTAVSDKQKIESSDKYIGVLTNLVGGIRNLDIGVRELVKGISQVDDLLTKLSSIGIYQQSEPIPTTYVDKGYSQEPQASSTPDIFEDTNYLIGNQTESSTDLMLSTNDLDDSVEDLVNNGLIPADVSKSLAEIGKTNKELIKKNSDLATITGKSSSSIEDLLALPPSGDGGGDVGGLLDAASDLFGDDSPIIGAVSDMFGELGGWLSVIQKGIGMLTNIMQQVEDRMTLFQKEQSTMSAYMQSLLDPVGSATYWEHVGQAVGTGGITGEILSNTLGSIGSLLASFFHGGISYTGLFRYEEYLSSMKSLVSTGYMKDLDVRTFLHVMRDQIAPNFDLTNSTLLRILRLVDSGNSMSTAQRMAIQTHLTRYLNTWYEDSSYIKDAFSSIEGNLIESISLKPTYEGMYYESIVQAWTGALYSAGVSQNTISNIAKGIDYLASGNVQGLTSDSSLMNLFGIGAARAGLSMADMLVNGIENSDIPILLGTITEYLGDIYRDNNNVVRSELARVFGLSVSDLVGFSNFLDDQSHFLNNIGDAYLSGGVNAELALQLASLFGVGGLIDKRLSRINVSAYFENVLDNVITQTAINIGNSQARYFAYKAADLVYQIGDVVGNVYPIAKIIGWAAKAAQVIGVVSELTGSITGAVTKFATSVTNPLNPPGIDVYNTLSGKNLLLDSVAEFATFVAKTMATDEFKQNSAFRTASASKASAEMQDVENKKKEEEAKSNKESAESLLASSNEADYSVRVVDFDSNAISKIVDALGNACIGSGSSAGDYSQQSDRITIADIERIFTSTNGGNSIANLMQSINNSMYDVHEAIVPTDRNKGKDILDMIDRILSYVESSAADTDDIRTDVKNIRDKYMLS